MSPGPVAALGVLLLVSFSPAKGGGIEDEQLRRRIDDLELQVSQLMEINAQLTLANGRVGGEGGGGSGSGGGSDTTQCVGPCLRKVKPKKCKRCFEAVVKEGQEMYDSVMVSFLIPQQIELPVSRVHPGIPEPTIGVPHHSFAGRPPHVHGKRPPSENKTVSRYQKHVHCPAMRGRSKVHGITVRFPYTARFYRDGAVEVVCDWITGSPMKRWEVNHPTVRTATALSFWGDASPRPPPPAPPRRVSALLRATSINAH